MADHKATGGVVNACLPLALLSVFVAVCHAAICPEKQYLNSKLQICMNCTDCKDGSVVLRPCELHRDTHCGPLSAISDLLDSSNSNHRHRHEKFRSDKQKTKGVVEWRYGENVDEDGSSRLEVPEAMEVSSSEAPFSRAEKLVWDWQAIALTSAVFACIMFFLVVTMYSLYQAKQWRRLKENFEADVEELSARLSLMATSSSEKCDFLDSSPILVATSTMGDSNYHNNRCIYLEQLLSVRKEDGACNIKPKGNVYIEESKTKK